MSRPRLRRLGCALLILGLPVASIVGCGDQAGTSTTSASQRVAEVKPPDPSELRCRPRESIKSIQNDYVDPSAGGEEVEPIAPDEALREYVERGFARIPSERFELLAEDEDERVYAASDEEGTIVFVALTLLSDEPVWAADYDIGCDSAYSRGS